MSRSCQGHIKVIWRSKLPKYLIKNIFNIFCCKGVFHKAAADILRLGKPSNTHPRGYSEYYVPWRGNTPPLYHPSPPSSQASTNTKSMQKMVNWSLVGHGLEVTKHMRHPDLGTKGDIRWGCTLLGFYCRVRSRSYKGHFKGKADQHKSPLRHRGATKVWRLKSS